MTHVGQCPLLLLALTQEEEALKSAKPSYIGCQTLQYTSPLLHLLTQGCWQEGVKQLFPNQVDPVNRTQSQSHYTSFNVH
jgi:hypothetical protein